LADTVAKANVKQSFAAIKFLVVTYLPQYLKQIASSMSVDFYKK